MRVFHIENGFYIEFCKSVFHKNMFYHIITLGKLQVTFIVMYINILLF